MAVRKSIIKVLTLFNGMNSEQLEEAIMDCVCEHESQNYELVSSCVYRSRSGREYSEVDLHFKEAASHVI